MLLEYVIFNAATVLFHSSVSNQDKQYNWKLMFIYCEDGVYVDFVFGI